MSISSSLCLAATFTLALMACEGTTKRVPLAPVVKKPPSDDLKANPLLPPRAYTDGLGIVVEIVPIVIPDGSDPKALLRISGIHSEIAGVTFVATRSSANNNNHWRIPLDGVQMIVVLIHQLKSGSQMQIITPRTRERISLEYAPEASKAIDVGDLITDYRRHKADGSLTALAAFNRKRALSESKQDLETFRSAANEACGADFSVMVDWQSIKDRDDFQHVSICSTALVTVKELCAISEATRLAINNKLQSISCKGRPEHSAHYDPEKRHLSVVSNSEDLPTPDQFKRPLAKLLGLRRTVLKSKNGLYVALSSLGDDTEAVYVGREPILYKQPGKWNLTARMFEFETSGTFTSLKKISPGVWSVTCQDRELSFQEVKAAERDRVLSFKRNKPIWNREHHTLARDNQGTYYYVDKLNVAAGGVGYRLFRGPRGALKLTTMVDIVDDDQGMIFSTKSGKLRLITARKGQEAEWLRGRKSEPLVVIPDFKAIPFVHGSLGVYDGEELGTICSLSESLPAQ